MGKPSLLSKFKRKRPNPFKADTNEDIKKALKTALLMLTKEWTRGKKPEWCFDKNRFDLEHPWGKQIEELYHAFPILYGMRCLNDVDEAYAEVATRPLRKAGLLATAKLHNFPDAQRARTEAQCLRCALQMSILDQ